MLFTIFNIFLAAFGIGFLIFIHELGHFVMAKKVGIRVETFSIGFGPSIVSVTRGDTEYRLAMIPLGTRLRDRIGGQTFESLILGLLAGSAASLVLRVLI